MSQHTRYVQDGALWVPEHRYSMTGLGDAVGWLAKKIGFKEKAGCGCAKRRATLNRWVPFGGGVRRRGDLPIIAGGAPTAFLNSSEPGCDGSDANVLFCEDFETLSGSPFNSVWGVCGDIIHGPSGVVCGGTGETCNKGWESAGNAGSPNGNRAVGVGVGGTNAGYHDWSGSGSCQGSGNTHSLGPTVITGYTDVYVRWYEKWPAGYVYGAEKVLSVNRDSHTSGIFWGNIHCNQGSGSTSPTCGLSWQGVAGSNSVGTSASLTSGVWWALQFRFKRPSSPSVADGIVQIWANNCGTTGTSCSGSMTLVGQDLAFPHTLEPATLNPWNPATSLVKDLWFEVFSNPASTCQSSGYAAASCPLIDNIKASRTGPLGFFGASSSTPPAAPTNLRFGP